MDPVEAWNMHYGDRGGELTGPAIEHAVRLGLIEITPFDLAQVAECSYDLRLGDSFLWYEDDVLDAAEPNAYKLRKIGDEGLVLWPGQLYLMHTVERVHTDHFKPSIDGKSSVARLGVQVHLTAGKGEPGFDGQWTLEVVVPHGKQVRVYAGMKIAQVTFQTLVGERRLYDGKKPGGAGYVGDHSTGPQPSRSWRQF